MVVDPSTGACTEGVNLFFNGPSGRGSTPSRAVAFSSESEYILTGVSIFNLFQGIANFNIYSQAHFTIVNTPDRAGCYKIKEGIFTDGPFDIYTSQTGTEVVNVPLYATTVYNTATFEFDYKNVELRTIALDTGIEQKLGTFAEFETGVFVYGLAAIPYSYSAPALPSV